MRIVLKSSVYTAHRGYGWSNVPGGMTAGELDGLLKLASATRSEFPTERDLSAGAVSDGRLIAVYTIRTVPAWDAEGRSADYAAFAFVDRAAAPRIDFDRLLAEDFFSTPSKAPSASIVYEGPAAARCALDVPGRLLSRNRISGFPFAAAGALLGAYADKSARWTIETDPATGLSEVRTAPWHARRARG